MPECVDTPQSPTNQETELAAGIELLSSYARIFFENNHLTEDEWVCDVRLGTAMSDGRSYLSVAMTHPVLPRLLFGCSMGGGRTPPLVQVPMNLVEPDEPQPMLAAASRRTR